MLFGLNKLKDGEKNFREAQKIAKEMEDFTLMVKCLSLKTLAYQISGQLPNAFITAQAIEEMAIVEENDGIRSDALATQGQVLIESGDEISSLEKFHSALSIAEDLEDTHRIMKLKGALGHYSLTIASGQQAEAYFEEALTLAQELGDREAEIGYLGNLGTLYNWKGDVAQGIEVFKTILAYMKEIGNQESELQALQQITRAYKKAGEHKNRINFALRGVEMANQLGDPSTFFFYKNLIEATYSVNEIDNAHRYYLEAINQARKLKVKDIEVDLLINLGESYMVTEKPEKAMEIYQLALEGAQRLQRLDDRANLLGRIGVVSSDLGQMEDAISYHQQALHAAREHDLQNLEGEQLIMLAIAYQEMGDSKKALNNANQALQVFMNTKQDLEVQKVKQFIEEITPGTET